MGKNQHSKDKLYLVPKEWKECFGGKKDATKKDMDFRRLPFDCCSLAFTPTEHPYCTPEGYIYDLTSIMPFLKKFGVNPVTGEKMSAKDLVKITFHKNADGKYHCPVTFRIFNENSHIVAIRTSGQVYAREAIDELNIKPRYFKDLLSDEPFKSTDIITIQDPANLDKFNFAQYYHVKNKLKLAREKKEGPTRNIRTINAETRDILTQLDKTYKAPEAEKPAAKKSTKNIDKFNAAHFSTGRAAASFTSTAFERINHLEAATIDEDVLRYERVKKKGYVRMITTHGPLNLELHCDLVPKTCENFMKHCASGYYDDTIFFRSLRNFIIQGGDPTNTGKGGDSIWGGPFKDEFKPNLTHTGRGVLSMANAGSNTNKSQFFFTFRSAEHLNNKHTVFGKIVGGLETLQKMEEVEVDGADKPLEEISVITCTIFVDPYEAADEQLAADRQAERDKDDLASAEKRRLAQPPAPPKVDEKPAERRKGVGKYIDTGSKSLSIEKAALPAVPAITAVDEEPPKPKKSKLARSGLTDFSTW